MLGAIGSVILGAIGVFAAMIVVLGWPLESLYAVLGLGAAIIAAGFCQTSKECRSERERECRVKAAHNDGPYRADVDRAARAAFKIN